MCQNKVLRTYSHPIPIDFVSSASAMVKSEMLQLEIDKIQGYSDSTLSRTTVHFQEIL